ncbi:MAG: bifunctional diguanylate cyclase/phosphodiesterase [Aquificaceae bacterium]|nr:bifunctional diguanylate cyclase/phosphodiesterase [Aquificaceae bacterium]
MKGKTYYYPREIKGCSLRDVKIICVYELLDIAENKGFIYIVFNLEREFKEANAMLMKKLLLSFLALSISTYALYLFVEGLVIKELNQILSFINASSEGKNPAQSMPVEGKNEFSVIKKAINEAWKTIWKFANTDDLTGLYNRRKMKAIYEAELLSLNKPIFVALIDLDNFKDINDLFGHDFGDLVLVEFSKRLLKEARARNFYCGRFGGDEFILMGSFDEETSLRENLKSLKDSLSKGYKIGTVDINLTMSMGYVMEKDTKMPFYEALKECDIALYRGKGTTRDTIVVFSKEEEEKEKRKSQVLLRMKSALEMGEFYLVYQPIFNVDTSSVIYYEALLRWTSPTLGEVSPAEFIEYAETSGFIIELGKFVIRRAVADSKKFGLPVSINISARQFYDTGFTEYLEGCIVEEKVDSDMLILEITETQNVIADELILSQVMKLKSKGFKISLDDFGAGYSNITLLNKLKPNVLKIDIQIIRGLEVGEESLTLVEAIVDMARAFGIEVVAEGVDSEKKVEKLKELGVKKMQGFYFARPERIENILGLSQS